MFTISDLPLPRTQQLQLKLHIHLVELPFNSTNHGLTPNTKIKEALPLPQVVNLFHSSIALEAPFRSLVNEITIKDGQPPLCIIFDVFIGWATNVAKSCGTVSVFVATSPTPFNWGRQVLPTRSISHAIPLGKNSSQN
ncbi:unnamed protein product [Fraxinus pennsylvanica]|uniref:Uncharacterized protein n=1 Tax=Fraxinus pennsylvanica TaxID=56036 RepID=A0AAD2A005_9LAMI|nr:unnamed protein product [Fraxinus pennsylvanica]